MKFQLIVPMSGIGSRFIKAGYKEPKPLIKVDDREIIKHVVNIFPEIDSIIFICNKKHLNDKNLNLENKLKKLHKNVRVIEIDQHKKGPIYAVLKAIKFIDLNMPTIVNYCDFFCLMNFKKFNEFFKKSKMDGCVFTYKGFHPHMLGSINYAYVKKEKDIVIDIQEKKPFTNKPMMEEASSGSYYFRNGQIMKEYFEKTIQKDLNVNGEYYVSMSYKVMIEDGKLIKTFLVDHFMQWGTPEDLEEYTWYSNLFKSLISNKKENSKINDGCIMIPMAGEGSRFLNEGYQKPKPLIKVSGKPMFIQALNDLPISESTKFIIREDISLFSELKTNICETYPESDLTILKSPTRGQAETCYKGLSGLNLKNPLTISACDMGIIYNKKFFDSLLKDESIDIIIWGCRNYPGAIKKPNMYGWISEKNNLVKMISVKKPLQNPKKDPCIIGTFTYKRAIDFFNACEITFKKNKKVNGEFYVDSTINESINLGLNVFLMEVDYFLCWGTPDDLKTYNYWQECFHKWKLHPYSKNLDNDFI